MLPFQHFAAQVGRPTRWARAAVVLLLCALIFGIAGPSFAGWASRGAVVVLEVRGVIDPVVAQYVERGISAANSGGAELVVIQLDTPGGLDTAMRDITQSILNSDVPVAVFVAPSGARAASAGVFSTMAAHVAAMAPGTNIGAAHPVDLSQGEMSATMEDKVTNDAAAYLRAIAQQRDRNAEWAEEAVRQSASLTAHQALESQVVDLVADDLADLLAELDGHKVTTGKGEVTLELATAPVEEYAMTWLQVIAHGIVDPNIAYLLFSLGTLALIAEFYHPGAILPGVTGVISLILAFVALGSLPVNWGGIALIVLAFAFFVLDIKVVGFALSVAGAISFILGSLLIFSPFRPSAPTMPRLAVSPWLLAGMTALLVGFFTLVVTAALRAQRQTVLMSTQGLVGATGVAVSDLDPQGVVQVRSETWTAIAEPGPVSAGETVEVIGTDSLRLRVRRPS
jgi:membrane-bound serine protease (ClpP class)